MSRWTIYFWEPCISPHKLDLFRSLLKHEQVDHCVYVTQEVVFPERLAQGWAVESVDDIDVRISPTKEEVHKIITDAPPNALHLFSCTHWVPCVVQGLRVAAEEKARFGIMAEPRASEGIKGLLRWVHSWATERHIRRNAAFVLGIGRNGPNWFRRTGYRRDRIFPFAYFLPLSSEAMPLSTRDTPKVGYLGRLIKPKGFDLFLKAMPLLRNPVSIAIAGSGDRQNEINALTQEMSGRVDFRGTIPMVDVPAFLSEIDVLVVPSVTTDDGWAAVVSEALMMGTAVVSTSKVGASITLQKPWRGAVCDELTPRALARVVDEFVASINSLDKAQRQRRRDWAAAHLTGHAGAAYIISMLDYVFGNGPRPIDFYEDLSEVSNA